MSTKYGAYCGSANLVRIEIVPLLAFGVSRLACLPPDVPEFGAPQAAKARLATTAAARTEVLRKTLFMTHPICRGEAWRGEFWCLRGAVFHARTRRSPRRPAWRNWLRP